MRGRKPVPTKLKTLRGNPGKRALPKAEPKPRADAPDCPPHLDDEAKAEWSRVVPELIAVGLLTVVDRAALAAYCVCWSRWVAAERKVRELGILQKSKEPGKADYHNPWLSIANNAMSEMKAFLTEFGLSPASRVRVAGSGKPNAGDNPKAKFFRAR